MLLFNPRFSVVSLLFGLMMASLAFGSISHGAIVATGSNTPAPSNSIWTTGVDSTLIVSIGFDDYGTLDISGGSTFISQQGLIGAVSNLNNTATGVVRITGAGSSWTTNNIFRVADSGMGTLRVADGGSVNNVNSIIGSSIGSVGVAIVTGSGSTWNHNALTVGSSGTGTLRVADGGSVIIQDHMRLGFVAGSGNGTVNVSDPNSFITVGSQGLDVGRNGSGTLRIFNGGRVSVDGSVYIARLAALGASHGLVRVSGANSLLETNGDIEIAFNISSSNGSNGNLVIEDHGTVTAGGHITIQQTTGLSRGTVQLFVSGNHQLQAGTSGTGNFINNGTVNLYASAGLAAGTYSPIAVGASSGAFLGSGDYNAIGGIWNSENHTFTVGTAQNASSGSLATVILSLTQRLNITGSEGQVILVFDPNAEATGGGSSISFLGTENSVGQIDGYDVLSAWDFDTDLALGSNVQLSLNIGTGQNTSQLEA